MESRKQFEAGYLYARFKPEFLKSISWCPGISK